jgi:hypothetical protein
MKLFLLIVTACAISKCCTVSCIRCAGQTICLECQQQYFLNNFTCYKCAYGCHLCTNLTACTQCDYGFILENQICIKRPVNCNVCYNSHHCIECEDYYGLVGGSCIRIYIIRLYSRKLQKMLWKSLYMCRLY